MLENVRNSEYRGYVDLTSKRHRKIHVDKPSIFCRFWKSNPCRNIHLESISLFPSGFAFQNRCNFHEISTWNFDVELMANHRRCVHWDYLVHFGKFNFCILSLLLGNGVETLWVNPGCLKCISGVHLSPDNKNLFTILFILYFF